MLDLVTFLLKAHSQAFHKVLHQTAAGSSADTANAYLDLVF